MVKTEVATKATPLTEAPADVYRQLREAIVSGEFQPNERLVEVDLARRLNTGRTSIRAALVRLDQEGLVAREPNRGARVRLVSDREAIEIEQVRIALEILIVRYAAEKVSPADLEDLRVDLLEMRKRLDQGDPLGYSELNARFHQRIWAIAEHETATKLLATLKSQSLRFQFRTILRPGRTERSLEEHRAIVEALSARDPEASERAMTQHLSHVVETLKWAIETNRRQAGWRPR
ncbi:MAG: GntR family transcriptional regulator [Candidatus Dormibacter sp.]